ncbi:hypothetical protein CAPTEDRAFT_224264 [Capitella teleta]|uniref:Disintegrin domain-containing protein n=1 Tax=Capitella teleta TaxID=283909 RepID=R7V4B2_CAPTE|nr:hypothetical protein CAPTEDRAFT_224264 [Capitella teleta]|eukprot:ELU11171.1 hypothetical protein CAPTEDRAFT_224264 [Capitella teleta]
MDSEYYTECLISCPANHAHFRLKAVLLNVVCQHRLNVKQQHIKCSEQDLDDSLRHYETLDGVDFDHHITRRSADGSSIHERQLKFDMLGRHFHLSLRQRSNILAPTFKLFVLDENLLEKQVDYQPDSLYEGYVHECLTVVSPVRTNQDLRILMEIGLIVRIDSLFRKTDFSNGFYGMGFEIKEIHIHQNPTPVSPGRVHYNTEKHNWNTRELLEAFSMAPQHSEFCLSHLFTALSFSNGMLGGSYIASSVITNPGGICSSAYYKNGHQLFLNTAFSSSLNQYGRRLLTSEADLVTTHGHNWGSEHDPDTSECSPSTKDGGKHIMYTYSVSGYEPNNKLFSPCSRRSIGAVLLTKSKSCFSEKSSGFCGNLVIEEGEECDVGFGLQNDPCCSVDCKLRPGAQCSDLNHNCCEGCQVASNRKICYEGNNELCAEEGYCSGASSICPDPPHIADGTACYNRGKCLSGQCLPMCESHGMVSCICDSKGEIKDELTEEQDHSCQYCCKETLDSPCEPFTGEDGTFINLDDAFPCERGLCYQGECQHSHSAQDQAERLWDIDEKLPTTTMSNENATDSETEVKSCAIRSQPFYEQLGLRAPLLLLFTQVLQFVDILLLSK